MYIRRVTRRFPREWMRTLVASQQFKKNSVEIDKNNDGSGKNFINVKKYKSAKKTRSSEAISSKMFYLNKEKISYTFNYVKWKIICHVYKISIF